MNRFLSITIGLFFASGLVATPAFAQEEEERKIQYKKRTEIDFEGVEVAGELVKPQGALLLDRKRRRPALFQRRPIQEAVDALQRGPRLDQRHRVLGERCEVAA